MVTALTPYVAAILGNVGDAHSLLRPGQDAHHLMLSPSQIEAIEHADILVIPDLSMSPFIAAMAAKRPRLKVIELSKLSGAHPLPYQQENAWLADAQAPAPDITPMKQSAPNPLYPKRLPDFGASEPQPTSTTSTIDPHFWLDPERMAAIAPALAEQISNFSPGEKATYYANAQALARHLRDDVMPSLWQILASRHAVTASGKEMTPFITSHAAYQYFLARFDIANPGALAIRPDEYLGAATLAAILQTAKKIHIRCIITESKTRLSEQVAELSDAHIVILSPEQLIAEHPIPPLSWIQNDYDRLLYDMARQFSACL